MKAKFTNVECDVCKQETESINLELVIWGRVHKMWACDDCRTNYKDEIQRIEWASGEDMRSLKPMSKNE